MSAKKGGRLRSASSREANGRLERQAAEACPDLAGFVSSPIAAQDMACWPVRPFSWLQPEWGVYTPAASGLRIERSHKIPMPGFLPLAAPPVSGRDARPQTGVALRGASGPVLPPSGLVPLGWDARVLREGVR